MKSKGRQFGFWCSTFPNQLGNLCFIIFLIGLALFVLHAVFDLNVFDPDSFKSTDERIPALGTRRVVDEAGVLTQSEIDSLTAQIDAYEAASKAQMAVFIIQSLHGDAIEDFSLAVAEKWQIGWRGEDNGVLLLLAMNEHESRLEIGYGLEGVINDARAGDILRDMAPYMRKAQFEKAISFVIASVAAFVLNENGPEKPAGMDDEDEDGGYAASTGNDAEGVLFCVIAILIVLELIGTIVARLMIHPDVKKSVGLIAMIIILRILLEVLKGMARGGGRGGSSGGGGSSRSGGGGGSFGGGGASGRW
jgi:uncharacterized protein